MMKNLHFPLAALALGLILSSNTCADKNGGQTAQRARGKWVLEQLEGAPVTMPQEVKMPYIEIDSLGQNVSGFAGCNRIFGTVKIWGDSIAFPGLAATRMYCEETQNTEDRFLGMLGHAKTFSLKDGLLELKGGTVLATFRKEEK